MSIARTLIKLREFNIVSAETLPYGHPAATTANVKQALDWIFAVLYPNSKPSVATVGDLPLVGNSLNDYRVVFDDGDGKAAGYRFEEREGDPAPQWYKIHDMDWSSDAILASFLDATQDKYVHKNGRMDLDANGNPITGIRSGQTVYGGSIPNSNITLSPNSGDGTGPQSGHVQLDGHTRPTSDDTFDLGTASERFRDIFFNGAVTDGVLTLTLADLDAAFSHSEIINANPHSTSYDQLATKLGTLTVDGDVSGSVDLSVSGDKTLSIMVGDDSHSHDALTTINNFDTATYQYLKSALVDGDIDWIFDDALEEISHQITIDTANISDIASTIPHGMLYADSVGAIWQAARPFITLSGKATGTAQFDGDAQGWGISVTALDSNLKELGDINFNSKIISTVASGLVTTFITSAPHGLQTGEKITINSIATDTTPPLLDETLTVTVIDSITFTAPISTTGGSGPWSYLPQGGQILWDPDTKMFKIAKEYEEIFLSELSGLNQDVLLQYVKIDGRSGGQTVQGGISAGESLVLESTVNATKGTVETKDTFTPFTTTSYSGSWSGTDLGSSAKKWRNLYMSGEVFGLRPENVATLPMASGTEIGRMVFYNGQLYTNNGVSWNSAGAAAVDYGIQYLSGNGTQTVYTLASDPLVAERVSIYINGVYQFKNTYTVTGTSLTFSEAPASGTQNIEVVIANLQSNPSALADATTTTKGAVRLSGDLGGTADSPTVKKYVEIFNAPIVFGTSGISQLLGATYHYAPANFTVTKVEVQLFTKGTATTGNLEIDVLKASTLGGSPVDYVSIMTTKPVIDLATAVDYQVSTGAINASLSSINTGDFLRLDITSVPANLQSIHVRVYGF